MKRFVGVALGAASLAWAAPAAAQTTLCDANHYVCVVAEFTLTNSTTLNMFVANGASPSPAHGSVVTWLGAAIPNYSAGGTLSSASFWNSGSSTALTVGTNNDWAAGSIAQFSVDLGLAAKGGSGGISTCPIPSAGGNNPKWSTCDKVGPLWSNGWDYLVFTWTLNAPLQTVDGIEFAWKAQSIVDADGGSLECGTSLTNPNSNDHLCTPEIPDTPQEVVPEPATMTLLATGLMGLAAADRRRRKKG